MDEYHKIQSVFKRDPETNHKTFTTEYSLPEFEYLKDNMWVATEKVDGTNIRISVEQSPLDCALLALQIGGRTNNAQIPAPLVQVLNATFLPKMEKMFEMFGRCDFTLYGEGYGGKIQKCSEIYGKDQKFILFDIQVGDWWLQRKDVEEIAATLGLPLVSVIYTGTLNQMVDIIKEGDSCVSSRVGNGKMEGYVMRPLTELKTRSGHRMITKLKLKDFK